ECGDTPVGVNLTLMAGHHSQGDRKGAPLLYTENPLARLVYSRDGACPRPRMDALIDLALTAKVDTSYPA
ncbi:MAG: hypothetical protein ACXVBU_17845, partial [Ktedonobacteraceae bacterium]